MSPATESTPASVTSAECPLRTRDRNVARGAGAAAAPVAAACSDSMPTMTPARAKPSLPPADMLSGVTDELECALAPHRRRASREAEPKINRADVRQS